MQKTLEEIKLESDSNKYLSMNKVIDNIKVKQQNGRLWTPYHDMQLYEYVIKYKFNFYEISNAFQRLCTNDKKYEYSEDAVRLHWAFLHSMRHFGQTPDEAYYQRMKLQYDKEKPKTFKKRVEEKEEIKLSEEEDVKRMKQEFDKMMKDKYGKDYQDVIEGNKKGNAISNNNEENKKDNININNNIIENNEIKVELDKKEKEEVEQIINETKRKKEEEENLENNKENVQTNEKNKEDDNNKDNKENKEEKNEENKLYDEADEPEFIKQLFNKQIPQEILDKLNKDEEKYNKTQEKSNSETEKISVSISKKIDINQESSNINQKIETKIIIENEEEDLFPIKSNKQKEISEPGRFENINMEKELQNTQDFHDYIASNPELKKQYDQLNNYCNFAVKSINYLVSKSTGVNNTSSEEAKKIEQTNKQLNELLLEPIIKGTKEKGYTLEDWNKKIEEEENKINFETTNYDNYMKNAPQDEEREIKLNKFKEHLFSFAEKISTEELLEKITGIINQNQNNNDDNNSNNINNINNNNENEGNNNNIENINNINNINNLNNNNINLENAVQNFMDNLENNNNIIEDEKSELTKEQSESVNENLNENNGRNTISSIGSLEFPKKYRHVYRGMVYYDEKPNPNDKKNNNSNNRNRNKKKIQDDDEIEEDDDEDEDEYNK